MPFHPPLDWVAIGTQPQIPFQGPKPVLRLAEGHVQIPNLLGASAALVRAQNITAQHILIRLALLVIFHSGVQTQGTFLLFPPLAPAKDQRVGDFCGAAGRAVGSESD